MMRRVANLDFARALAITLVVACNAVGEAVVSGPGARFAEAGWVGVDLFFVLSGWLIGGLYWRERDRFGDVEIGRFWARRWLRTIPPYLVALVAIYSVRAAVTGRTDPFDWSYLVFAQNYAPSMPYWGVSWSLCVEEHFYLALPLLLALVSRVRGGVLAALGLAVVVSLGARLISVPEGASQWGLHYTATHMRMEGLALGVALAYVFARHPAWWPGVVRGARWLVVPGLVFVAAVPFLPVDVLNWWGYTGVDLAFAALLVVLVARGPVWGSRSGAVRAVALTSYSVYMTHMTAFDAYRRVVMERAPGVPAAFHVVGALVLVAVVGGTFYLAVERPALWLRHRLAPRRPEALPLAVEPVPEPARPLGGAPVPL